MDTTTDRSALEGKLIPELQQIAQRLGIEGSQKLRKAGLIDAIVEHSSGDGSPSNGPAASSNASDGGTTVMSEPASDERAPRADGGSNGQRHTSDDDRSSEGERDAGNDRPRAETDRGERQPGDRQPNDRSQGNRSRNDRSQGDRQGGDRSQGGRPQGDRQQGDRPRGDGAQGDRPRGDDQGGRTEGGDGGEVVVTRRPSSARTGVRRAPAQLRAPARARRRSG